VQAAHRHHPKKNSEGARLRAMTICEMRRLRWRNSLWRVCWKLSTVQLPYLPKHSMAVHFFITANT